MKNKEVATLLSAIIIELNDDGSFMCDGKYLEDTTKLLRHAIKCVELMPEVLNELYKYRELIKHNCELFEDEDGYGHGRSFTELLAENEVPETWYRIDAILKKAKELIE